MSPCPPAPWLDEVVGCLRRAFGNGLRAVVLFGSYARGEARADSDVDILVVAAGVSSDQLSRHRRARMALLPVLDRLPAPVSLIVRTPEEFSANLTPLLLDVCVDGVCLAGDDYFDPFRTRALHALRESGLERRKVGGTTMWLFSSAPSPSWALSWDGFHAG